MLSQLDEAHALGIEPAALLRGLMESLHAISRVKAGATDDALQSAEERDAARALAGSISWGALHRLWQLLLKGLTDVGIAPDPHEAATMALLRLMHAADMPDPASLIAQLSGGGAVAIAPGRTTAAQSPGPVAQAAPADFAAFIRAIEASGKTLLALQLHDNVGLVRFAPGEMVLKPLKPLGTDFARELASVAKEATGTPWEVRLTDEGGAPSLQQQEAMAEERVRAEVMGEPTVRALLDAFPDATYVSHQRKEA
jgi:DNA polymerase-3 subunit gamma/tau